MVDFDTNAGLLADMGISVVAASVDSADQADALKDSLRLGFVQMASNIDAAAVSESTGAFMQSGERVFLHATGFVLNPEGESIQSVYSSGPIGRLNANDVLKKVRFELNRAG